MSVDLNLLEILMDSDKDGAQEYTIHLNDSSYPLTCVSVINSPTPVNEPTTRGGVYFSDKFAYKMKGIVEDLSVVPMLTEKMLGPNKEFGVIVITVTLVINGDSVPVSIHANLTNSVQTPSAIELSMIIVKLEAD